MPAARFKEIYFFMLHLNGNNVVAVLLLLLLLLAVAVTVVIVVFCDCVSDLSVDAFATSASLPASLQ